MDAGKQNVANLAKMIEVMKGETGHCPNCGEAVALWPPETMPEHRIARHADILQPGTMNLLRTLVQAVQTASQTTMIELSQSYMINILADRADIYRKALAAGAILPQGVDA